MPIFEIYRENDMAEMNADTLTVVLEVFMIGFVAYLFILLIILQIKYSSLIESAKNMEPEYREDIDEFWSVEEGTLDWW